VFKAFIAVFTVCELGWPGNFDESLVVSADDFLFSIQLLVRRRLGVILTQSVRKDMSYKIPRADGNGRLELFDTRHTNYSNRDS